MSLPSTRVVLRLGATLGAALLLLALVSACDENNGQSAMETASPSPTTEEPGATESLQLPSETGEEPIFWRTIDAFESVQADEPYKVVVRVTSGFEDEKLLIAAEHESGVSGREFSASRAEPTGDDSPGSYYTFELLLPQAGAWEVTALADDDRATVSVDVSPG